MNETEQLQERIRVLKREVRIQQESLERKNKALTALHYVWCNGGCECMVGEITEEVVAAGELNTKRLRTWFENKKFKTRFRNDHEFRQAWFKEKGMI